MKTLQWLDAAWILSHQVPESGVELLDADRIKGIVSRDDVTLEVLWSTGSTNTYLMGMSAERFSGYKVCLAEQQQAGRGRRGRRWISPFGSNLYMSLARRFTRESTNLGGLSLAVGIQVVKALKAYGVAGVGLKWPNDVMMDQGKLAGILVEVGPPINHHTHTVIGIGLNTHLSREDRLKIDQPPGTLEGMDLSRNELAGQVLNSVIFGLDRFAEKGFSDFYREWDSYNLYRGKEVTVHLGDQGINGVDAGVDTSGNLLLNTVDGVRVCNAGEVSLRAGAGR
ncbi:MAG: biotin--[acetyl-CoA-carboxylase] ligase [Gammaproteobacteria bacterium]|nr:biotin--[acetyl-CoA-carboxylase] ligase [Gammaproteobacteria bacterium]